MVDCNVIRWDWEDVVDGCNKIIEELKLEKFDPEKTVIYGIARGGVVPAYIIAKKLGIDYFPVYRIKNVLIELPVINPKYGNIIVIDDRAQTGSSLYKSKREAYRIYSKYHENPTIKTALLNALDLCRYKPDYIYKKTDNNIKIEFPWKSESLVAKITYSPIIKGAVNEFEKARKKIDDEINKGPERFFDIFPDNETVLLCDFHKKIFRSPSDEFKIIGELSNVKSINEFLAYLERLRQRDEIYYFENEDPNYITVEEDEYKDCIINFTILGRTYGGDGMEFSMSYSENCFARCESSSFEPHFFCHKNCNFKPEKRKKEGKSVETYNCFGIVYSMMFLQKIKKLGANIKIKEIVEE